MKKTMFFQSLPLVLIACFFFASGVSAQTVPAPAAKVRKAEKTHKHGDKLAADLNLSEEQKAEFKKIDAEYAEKSKAQRAARKEEKTKNREARIKAHKALLNPEQAAKYDEILAKKQAKREARLKDKKAHKHGKKAKKAEKKAIKKELKKQ